MNDNRLFGDEIGALVFDPGHNTFRAGYAGEDIPKVDVPSAIGVFKDSSKIGSDGDQTKEYTINVPYIYRPKKGMEMTGFLKNGTIEDWDLFEKMLDHIYSKCMCTVSAHHPLLISEAPWNTQQKREKLTELMFEKYNVPAFYVAKNVQLAAYCNGRASGIMVDCGATHTTAVPIYDGHVISQAVVSTPLGGDFLSVLCRQYLEEQGVELTPSYQIGGKEVVQENMKPKWTKRNNLPEVTQSYHNYMVKELLQDFQSSVLQVSDTQFDEEAIKALPMVHYEFPNGYHQDFGPERFRIPEVLFDPSIVNSASKFPSVSQIVTSSVSMCDIDIRPSLYSAVILTGGNSLLQGLQGRLSKDLTAKTPPSLRLKVVSSNASVERKYGAWIGGSILASLGSFQQEWMSRQEYNEFGKHLVERKCQ